MRVPLWLFLFCMVQICMPDIFSTSISGRRLSFESSYTYTGNTFVHLPSMYMCNYVHPHAQVLLQLLSTLNLPLKQTVTSRFKQQLASAWNKNGDSLSQLYAGTRALRQEGKTSKVRRETDKSFYHHGAYVRAYIPAWPKMSL